MEEYEIFQNKRTDKVYLSKLIEVQTRQIDNGEIQEITRPLRILSKIIDVHENHKFIKDGKEISLRITPGERQEIKAKFYEDTRGVSTLQIQKYSVQSGSPHNTYFTFTGLEIEKLYYFVKNIALLPIKDENKARFDDKFLEEIILTKEQALKIISEHPEIIKEIIENEITKKDIVNLGYRKKQLIIFEKLLHDEDYFLLSKDELGPNKRNEDVWQEFFERNTWILGYGLDFVINSPLEDKKLEQVVSGHSFNSSGKRIDALLKRKGLINSLCFVEIKTQRTPLLKQIKRGYRPESWSASDDLAGGIVQVQKTVQKSIKGINTKIQIKNEMGDLTGEELFLYQPKSFLIIGMLDEFNGEFGINEDKFSSFELFRRNTLNPEILTFDELFERAKYIVKSSI
ncbi:MAG: Shedu immune nuclease family protein [Ignavibacteriaceae bacterium]|jgi:hypothetical protein